MELAGGLERFQLVDELPESNTTARRTADVRAVSTGFGVLKQRIAVYSPFFPSRSMGPHRKPLMGRVMA